MTELDMTDNSNQCPSTLTQRIDSDKRTCGTGQDTPPVTLLTHVLISWTIITKLLLDIIGFKIAKETLIGCTVT